MLTAKQIDALLPKEKSYRVADSRGLSLRVDPTGAKYWVASVTRADKRTTVSLGRWPDVSAVEARRKLAEATAHKESGCSGYTFRAVAEEWHRIKSGSLSSDKYAKLITSRIEADLLPRLGDIDISKITRRDLVTAVQAVADRGVRETAKRIAQYVGQIMDYAVDCGIIQMHPGANLVRVLPAPERGHHAAVSVSQAGELFRDMWGWSGSVVTAGALRLAVLTALRARELAGARWSEMDGALWVVPEDRMKRRMPHVVPLSRQALVELGRLRLVSGRSEFIFDTGRGRFMHPETPAKLLQKMGYGGVQTQHGLRSIFSTVANESGLWSRDAIERQLSHQETDAIRAAYHRAEYLEERTRLMQWWADWVDQSMGLSDSHP